MRIGHSVGAFVVVLALAACQNPGTESGAGLPPPAPPSASLPAITTTAPRYSDALAGLYPTPASAVPSDIAVNYYAPAARTGSSRAVLTMALVPGANYGGLRAYHARVTRDAANAAPGEATVIANDLQIQPILLRAVDIVKQQYPWLELTDDIATAQQKNVSLTLVLDLRSALAQTAGNSTLVEVEVIVFDAQRKPVSRIAGNGTAIARGDNGYGFQEAAEQALDALAAKSKTYLN